MYQLSLVRTSDTKDQESQEPWTLFRRYSQFHQLKTILNDKYPQISSLTFPPKQTFGNLVASFVENRKTQLQAWVTSVLSTEGMCEVSEILAFFEARVDGLAKPGTAAPTVQLKDLIGRTYDSKQFSDQGYLTVYSAASRYNFGKLVQVLTPPSAVMNAQFPTLK